MPTWTVLPLLWTQGAALVSPLPPVMIHSHYTGGREVITASVSVTCPKQGRYSMTLHQKTGSDIIIDELVSDDRLVPPSELQAIQDFLRGAVLEYARVGCASWTQAIVDVAVNRREGEGWRSVYIPIFLQHRTAELFPNTVRDRVP